MTASNLQTEILEQPEAVRRLLDACQGSLPGDLRTFKGGFNYILIAARGTSDNAARFAQYLLQNRNHVPVMLAAPSVFSIYGQTPRLNGALVVGISQSGQSPDIVSVLAAGRAQGCPTISLTNDPASPLAEASDLVVDLRAGPEKAVAATKTYTASLAAVAMLSCALGSPEDNWTPRDEDWATLARVPAWMKETLDGVMAMAGSVERYHFMQTGLTIGRGYNYATAFEMALKIMELNSLAMLSYSSADFLHGPIGILRKDFPTFVVAHSGAMLEPTLQIMARFRQSGADITAITDSQKARALADISFNIPAGVPEWLSPLTDVLPGQVIGWQLAALRGLDVDNPRGLSKVNETI